MRHSREPRRVRMLIAAVALLPLIVPLLACGAMSDRVNEAAFTASCAAECETTADRGLCETYCGCAYQYAPAHGRIEELNGARVTPGQPMPPVIVDVMAECGSAVYDASFRGGCARECASEMDATTCTTQCECVLRELRGSGPTAESTRFLVANLGVTPPTPEGQARMDAAVDVCVPAE